MMLNGVVLSCCEGKEAREKEEEEDYIEKAY